MIGWVDGWIQNFRAVFQGWVKVGGWVFGWLRVKLRWVPSWLKIDLGCSWLLLLLSTPTHPPTREGRWMAGVGGWQVSA